MNAFNPKEVIAEMPLEDSPKHARAVKKGATYMFSRAVLTAREPTPPTNNSQVGKTNIFNKKPILRQSTQTQHVPPNLLKYPKQRVTKKT